MKYRITLVCPFYVVLRISWVVYGWRTTILRRGWDVSTEPPSRKIFNHATSQDDRRSISFRTSKEEFGSHCKVSPLSKTLPYLLGLVVIGHHPHDAYAKDWDLINGSVTLPDPLTISFQDRRRTGMSNPPPVSKQQSFTLSNPEIIGAGGGGAVFSFNDSDMLLKVSWEGTSKTVQRECRTLQLLEDAGVSAAERCLAIFPYGDGDVNKKSKNNNNNDETSRTMILVTPYMKDAVASVKEVMTEDARKVAVDQIARTLVQMLVANIITIDVQPLISKTTGQTIFIDMTEAQVLSSSSPSTATTSSSSSYYSILDQTLISSFINEMVALIPESYWDTVARTSIMEELKYSMEQQGGSSREAAIRVQHLLKEQTPFL